jgi:hypothetical protein
VAKSSMGWLWHCWLAHVGMRNLAKLLIDEHIFGLTNVHFEKDRICKACQAGKQVGAPHPPNSICWGIQENPPPSKRQVYRNSWNKFLGWLNLWRFGILNLRSPEVVNLWRSGILNLRSHEVANLWRSGTMNLRSPEVVNLWRSGIMNLRSLEVANLWRYGVMNLQSSGVMNLRNSGIENLWNSRIYWSPNSGVMAHEDFHE